VKKQFAGAIKVVLSVLLVVIARRSAAQTVDSTLWCTGLGDRVFATARSGDTLYIAGNFLQVGPASGGGVVLLLPGDGLATRQPTVAGVVRAAVSDGMGGWCIAGSFIAVNGHRHLNIAHINGDGADDAQLPDANGDVYALAIHGTTLYIGGEFDSLGSSLRPRIGSVDVSSGVVSDWNPVADGRVAAICAVGDTVYLGGQFQNLGGQSRAYLAAVTASTATALPWTPQLNNDVLTMTATDTVLFVGGHFTVVNGVLQRYLAAISRSTGALESWDPQISRGRDFPYDGGPRVAALLLRDSTLFVGGSFYFLGGQYREGIGAINVRTAQATSWTARAVLNSTTGAYFQTLNLVGDTLFATGFADSVGGRAYPAGFVLCAIDARSGDCYDWDPRPNGSVFCLAQDGAKLFVGGDFTSVRDWVWRRGLASFDLATGRATSWDPETDDYVTCMAVVGDRVIVGGAFGTVGGMARAGLAAVDKVSGMPTAWNPTVNGLVRAVAPTSRGVIVGGYFTAAGGQSRQNLALIDAYTGLARAWNPSPNEMVLSLAATDSIVYVGGVFTAVGGQTRDGVAAVDTAGVVMPWAANVDGSVEGLAVSGKSLYLVGDFNLVAGQERNGAAAVSGSGAVLPWNPNAGGDVKAIALTDSAAYLGGAFPTIGGEPRSCIAAVDLATGAPLGWNPGAEGIVWTLAATQSGISAGGAFQYAGNWPQAGVALFNHRGAQSGPHQPVPSPLTVRCYPNPLRSVGRIEFQLSYTQPVHLDVFDMQGRRVSSLLSGQWQAAGPQRIDFGAGGWKPGLYVIRLRTSVGTSTAKLNVIR